MINPPNIMTPGTWVLAGIVLLVILIPAVIIGVKVWMTRIQWRTVQLVSFSFKVAGPRADAEVAAALLHAIEALCSVWQLAPVYDAVARAGVRVQVMAEESWLNSGGVKVGGEQDGNVLRVGRSMSALCHELAHLLEWKLDAVRDDAHAGWTQKAIWAADEKYRQAVMGGKS